MSRQSRATFLQMTYPRAIHLGSMNGSYSFLFTFLSFDNSQCNNKLPTCCYHIFRKFIVFSFPSQKWILLCVLHEQRIIWTGTFGEVRVEQLFYRINVDEYHFFIAIKFFYYYVLLFLAFFLIKFFIGSFFIFRIL